MYNVRKALSQVILTQWQDLSLVNFYNVINENDELFKKQFCISDKKLKLKIQMKLFVQLSFKLLTIIDFFVLSLLQFLNKTLLYLFDFDTTTNEHFLRRFKEWNINLSSLKDFFVFQREREVVYFFFLCNKWIQSGFDVKMLK